MFVKEGMIGKKIIKKGMKGKTKGTNWSNITPMIDS